MTLRAVFDSQCHQNRVCGWAGAVRASRVFKVIPEPPHLSDSTVEIQDGVTGADAAVVLPHSCASDGMTPIAESAGWRGPALPADEVQ